MRCSKAILLFIILTGLLTELAKAQSDPNSLQPGVPIERTIARGQSHSFTVSMEKDQVLQLVVDQRGIDVVARSGPVHLTGQRSRAIDTETDDGKLKRT